MKTLAIRRSTHLVHDALEQLASFGTWWWQELVEISRELTKRLFPNWSVQTVIALSPTGGSLFETLPGQDSKVAEFQRDSRGGLPKELPLTQRRSDKRAIRARVVLPKNALLLREFVFPEAVARNLDSVVHLQLERELPLPRDQVEIDWQIASRDSKSSRMIVRVAVARRSQIDELRELAQVWGVELTSIASHPEASETQFEFLRRKLRRRLIGLSQLDFQLIALCAGLLSAWVVIVGSQWWIERSKVNPVLAAARTAAQTVVDVRRNFDRESEPLISLRQMMLKPSTGELLVEITKALPADSWLQRLQLQNRSDKPIELHLTAITPVATVLVEQLRKVPKLQQVRLASAIAANSGSEKERADIVAVWGEPTELRPQTDMTGVAP